MVPAATVKISKSDNHFFHCVARLAPISPLSGLNSRTGWSEIPCDILAVNFYSCIYRFILVASVISCQFPRRRDTDILLLRGARYKLHNSFIHVTCVLRPRGPGTHSITLQLKFSRRDLTRYCGITADGQYQAQNQSNDFEGNRKRCIA